MKRMRMNEQNEKKGVYLRGEREGKEERERKKRKERGKR